MSDSPPNCVRRPVQLCPTRVVQLCPTLRPTVSDESCPTVSDVLSNCVRLAELDARGNRLTTLPARLPAALAHSLRTLRLAGNRSHTRSTQPCIPPGSLNRVPASAGGKGGNVTSAGWQVTLCDPMWHASSRSGVATLRTAIHLLLVTHLLHAATLYPVLCIQFPLLIVNPGVPLTIFFCDFIV